MKHMQLNALSWLAGCGERMSGDPPDSFVPL